MPGMVPRLAINHLTWPKKGGKNENKTKKGENN